MMRLRHLLASVILIGSIGAIAQGYPDRQIRMIVVSPPGGGADVVARLVAKKLGEDFGQPIVVDNRGGASGMIAGAAVAHSMPDGYTMLLSASDVALNVALFPKLPYDPVKAFAPVTLIATTPMVLVSTPKSGIGSLGEFVAFARANPGRVNYASGGVGTPQQFAMELLRLQAGLNINHVPYKSGGLQILGLLAGEVSVGFVALLPAIPHIREGRLRALAVSSIARSASLPEVPTVAELEYPGFDISQWYAAWLPAGTSSAIVSKLAAAIDRYVRSDDFRRQMIALGAEAVGSGEKGLFDLRQSEIAKYRDIAIKANIKAE